MPTVIGKPPSRPSSAASLEHRGQSKDSIDPPITNSSDNYATPSIHNNLTMESMHLPPLPSLSSPLVSIPDKTSTTILDQIQLNAMIATSDSTNDTDAANQSYQTSTSSSAVPKVLTLKDKIAKELIDPQNQLAYLETHIFPVLLPAIEKLLKTIKKKDGVIDEENINPIVWLAQNLYRNNPNPNSRHRKLTAEFASLRPQKKSGSIPKLLKNARSETMLSVNVNAKGE
ncbi:hypothetical protein BKA69DRAFT_1121125 [Paraphysoderma sedebokerense]|nr:hypothetical protein BKA69DRAFT_1121125 [Paraphysoderma sedebokerense]